MIISDLDKHHGIAHKKPPLNKAAVKYGAYTIIP
jgi:hypothetical protein